MPEARPRAGPVGVGGLVDLLGDRHQPGQDRDREERQPAPHVDRDDRGHRVVLLPEPVGARRVHEPQGQPGPVHHAVERVEHPPPPEGGERGGDDPRQQHRAPDQPLEPELLVEQEREHDPQHDLERDRDAGEHERVLEGLAEGVALPEADEVAEAHELAGPPDERVGQGQVEGHHERVGHQEQEEDEGRGDEERPQDRLAVEPAPHAGGQRPAARDVDLVGPDRHGVATLPFLACVRV